MKKQKEPRTVVYRDELNDEFSHAVIKPRRIDSRYRYLRRGPLFPVLRFILYRLLAYPIGYVVFRLSLGFRFEGREKLKSVKGQGIFLFANHTQEGADAFLPSYAVSPKGVYIVVHPSNVSQPLVGRLIPYLGALPLPSEHGAMRNFKEAIAARVKQGCCVTVYPEAHIWPYYTGIRPFLTTSFSFPVSLGAPSFCMTVTYRRRRFRKKPRAVAVLDGPFYPDESLPVRRRAEELRDRIYRTMKERATLSDCEYIRYIPASEEGTDALSDIPSERETACSTAEERR